MLDATLYSTAVPRGVKRGEIAENLPFVNIGDVLL